jgi:hypothetical protein
VQLRSRSTTLSPQGAEASEVARNYSRALVTPMSALLADVVALAFRLARHRPLRPGCKNPRPMPGRFPALYCFTPARLIAFEVFTPAE